MFIGHFAVGFGAKRFAPAVSLGTLFLACQFADLLWPLLIARTPDMRTLELGLAYFNSSTSAFRQTNWPLMMAASVVVMLPVLIIYIFAQRYFIKGISLSGVKG